MRKLVGLIAIVLLAFALTQAPSIAATPYDIDVLIPLTGPITFFGQAGAQALTLLEGVVNRQGGIRGRPVHFVIHDDQSSPTTALQLMTQVMAKNPAVVIGPAFSAACLAIAPLLKDGPVQYCFSPVVHPPAGSYTFAFGASTSDHVTALYRYFRSRGWKSIGMISSTDSSGQDADAEYDRGLMRPENRGMTMVVHEHFNTSDLSVAAQMARIKAAHPDVFVCYASGTPFATLLRGVQQAGIDVPIVSNEANMSYRQLKQYTDILPKELLFPSSPAVAHEARSPAGRAAMDTFYEALKDAGIQPDLTYINAWDPALVIVHALQALGPDATANQVRTYLENLHGFAGVNGDYDFRTGNQRGLGPEDIMVVRWDATTSSWVGMSDFGGGPKRR